MWALGYSGFAKILEKLVPWVETALGPANTKGSVFYFPPLPSKLPRKAFFRADCTARFLRL